MHTWHTRRPRANSGEKVTVETFACLFKVSMLAPVVLQFDVVYNLTFVLEWDCFDKFDLWPLNRRLDKKVTVDTFACLPEANMLAPLILPFDIV